MRRIFGLRYIIALVFISTVAWLSPSLFIKQHVVIYYDASRSGESSMAFGIASAIKQLDSRCSVEVFNSEQSHEFEKRLYNTPAKLVVIGQSGFDIITSHKLDKWDVFHVTHQIFNDHRKVKDNITFFVPKHLMNYMRDTKNVKWISGVPVNINKEEILTEYEKHAAEIPKADSYLILILAGDVETPERGVSIYTPQEAENLAKYVNTIANSQHIIVLNGPRTGKHCSADAHKNGKPDCVTESFLKALKKQATLFDFQFGKPSLYKAVLGLAAKHKGTNIYVPGESNSMITDMQVLGLPATIYGHSAMNHMHKANVEASNMPYLDENFHMHTPTSQSREIQNPNVEIAEFILHR